ncbi:Tylosin resistance ATP-binding protein tlrC [Streptomyces mobaraensis NBRC 13819 = DSM 40847]|uniref:Tylosin resistance ATP-binding protein tlrC n=1 Tax=Streptomyces mobaraensis (strain ATCC 29032 / DSM 40847 / JCM 4168 / NBRC 13819 / NCIMB 11159 / IPCR 16-22) TaxID=1223523 RepID=M3AVN3_STRM1|nr:Tylosin resistance ATP-binding protein tlrC [Streptomyces mobaraensis NBRC 13819 = DSM 40847]
MSRIGNTLRAPSCVAASRRAPPGVRRSTGCGRASPRRPAGWRPAGSARTATRWPATGPPAQSSTPSPAGCAAPENGWTGCSPRPRPCPCRRSRCASRPRCTRRAAGACWSKPKGSRSPGGSPPIGLSLAAGDRLLVTGANGAGKSTLLDVLAGRTAPDGGRIVRRGRTGPLAQRDESGPPTRTVLAAYAHGCPGHRRGTRRTAARPGPVRPRAARGTGRLPVGRTAATARPGPAGRRTRRHPAARRDPAARRAGEPPVLGSGGGVGGGPGRLPRRGGRGQPRPAAPPPLAGPPPHLARPRPRPPLTPHAACPRPPPGPATPRHLPPLP